MPEGKTEPKAPKSKLVDVEVLSTSGDTSFVSYHDKSIGVIRVNIPSSVIVNGKAPVDELDMGIPSPTDIDWGNLRIKSITAAALAKAMHDEGIFTLQDTLSKRQVMLVAINRLSGLLVQDIYEQLQGGNQ
jgi:hypothetical protein